MSVKQRVSAAVLAVVVVAGAWVPIASAEPVSNPMQTGPRHKITSGPFSDINACNIWVIGMRTQLTFKGNKVGTGYCSKTGGVAYGIVYYYGAKL